MPAPPERAVTGERHAFLGPAWCEAVAGAGRASLEGTGDWPSGQAPPGLSVQVVVSGRAAGERRLTVELDGAGSLRVTEGAGASAPDVVLAIGADDAEAVLSGELRLDVAYMQGRAKLAGDHALVLRLLAATAEPGWETFRTRVAGLTSFDR